MWQLLILVPFQKTLTKYTLKSDQLTQPDNADV